MENLDQKISVILATIEEFVLSLPLPGSLDLNSLPAWMALAFSLIALFVSFTRKSTEREYKVKTTSEFVRSGDGRPDTVVINLENTGKKPILLSMAWGRYSDGSTKGLALEGPRGVRLGVGEKYTESYEDYMALNANAARLVEVWYEDFLGHEYMVKNAGKLLHRLTR